MNKNEVVEIINELKRNENQTISFKKGNYKVTLKMEFNELENPFLSIPEDMDEINLYLETDLTKYKSTKCEFSNRENDKIDLANNYWYQADVGYNRNKIYSTKSFSKKISQIKVLFNLFPDRFINSLNFNTSEIETITYWIKFINWEKESVELFFITIQPEQIEYIGG